MKKTILVSQSVVALSAVALSVLLPQLWRGKGGQVPQAEAQGVDEYRRDLQRAQAVAVPEQDRPRRYIVADFLVGARQNATVQNLDDGLHMLSLLGMNTVEVKFFEPVVNEVEARARKYGFTQFRHSIYTPVAIPADRTPPLYFSWNLEETAPARVDEWGRSMARDIQSRGEPTAQTVLFHMADEPGWYFPDILTKMTATPARAAMFQKYLQSKNLQPRDLGFSDWAQVRPIAASQARDVNSRRLYYWTVLYLADTAADGFRIWNDALRRHINPNLMVTSNWNNWVSRFYMPGPNEAIGKNKYVGPDGATGAMDWWQVGRKRAVSALWSEDWFTDVDAQKWSFMADALRCAAAQGAAPDYQPEFGSFVVGQRLGDHPAGGRYKALSLLGHGAKVLEWYVYGPKSKAANGYSENVKAYGQIASANRMIGRAEDVMYPGRRAPARIAILLPRSAQVWDTSQILPRYQLEMQGLHYALTHAQYPVDFVDETEIENGDLTRRGYFMIYVTAPNMTTASQRALLDWINRGGTAIFSPGAAAADEYNTPVNILDDARGLANPVLPRRTAREDGALRAPVKMLDSNWGSVGLSRMAISPLQLRGARALGEFGTGGIAVASHKAGQGLAVSFGFWPGISYFNSARRGLPDRLPLNYDAGLRSIITAAPRLTNIGRPVELSVEAVEATRLDSSVGSAITLLNWTDEPQNAVTVRVKNAGVVRSVSSVEQGNLQFSREGDDIRVTMPLRDVDVLMLRR